MIRARTTCTVVYMHSVEGPSTFFMQRIQPGQITVPEPLEIDITENQNLNMIIIYQSLKKT